MNERWNPATTYVYFSTTSYQTAIDQRPDWSKTTSSLRRLRQVRDLLQRQACQIEVYFWCPLSTMRTSNSGSPSQTRPMYRMRWPSQCHRRWPARTAMTHRCPLRTAQFSYLSDCLPCRLHWSRRPPIRQKCLDTADRRWIFGERRQGGSPGRQILSKLPSLSQRSRRWPWGPSAPYSALQHSSTANWPSLWWSAPCPARWYSFSCCLSLRRRCARLPRLQPCSFVCV